ncbi:MULTISPECIES: orotate phosphoribosyltransferase [Sinobaca]|uniref:Orotate phosphoribosyltransferase n=1 Tax=Sinobaca qinghaiensis TaxID=342944 RepID=A0A419V687_9BACL|nr:MULTISPECIES: orotate phosphoribosyltransferase [Sinobaca]RKD75426.1 orotate phosphoribosyltransferase [Sinobaca qinghaiensis]
MEHEIAKELLKIQAVSLSPAAPYTWSSGMKSPIYCDNRLTLSYPSLRTAIAEGLAEKITAHFPEADVLAGTATAGIAHAALTADKMQLPMVYVRSSSKSHGKGNQIEGQIKEGQKVVIVEDLISTGKSIIEVQRALESAGAVVLGAAAIFTYGLQKGTDQLQEAGLTVEVLTGFDALIEAAEKENYIEAADMERLKQWKQNPESEDWMSR